MTNNRKKSFYWSTSAPTPTERWQHLTKIQQFGLWGNCVRDSIQNVETGTRWWTAVSIWRNWTCIVRATTYTMHIHRLGANDFGRRAFTGCRRQPAVCLLFRRTVDLPRRPCNGIWRMFSTTVSERQCLAVVWSALDVWSGSVGRSGSSASEQGCRNTPDFGLPSRLFQRKSMDVVDAILGLLLFSKPF